MNSRANNWALVGGLTLAVMAGSMLTACEKKKAPPPPPPPPAPVAVGPDWTLEDIAMDPRVQFPENRTPSTRELAEAIAQLATAIITGNDRDMTDLLDPIDHAVMSDLVSTGGWKDGTTGIEAVRVCVLEEGEGKTTCRLGLGVQDPLGAYLLAWTGASSDGRWTFQGLAIVPQIADRVAALDGASLIEPAIDTTAPVIVELPDSVTQPENNVGTDGSGSSPGDAPPPPTRSKPPG
jgi:hypothetical protein